MHRKLKTFPENLFKSDSDIRKSDQDFTPLACHRTVQRGRFNLITYACVIFDETSVHVFQKITLVQYVHEFSKFFDNLKLFRFILSHRRTSVRQYNEMDCNYIETSNTGMILI
jgi:hypothetical protein